MNREAKVKVSREGVWGAGKGHNFAHGNTSEV